MRIEYKCPLEPLYSYSGSSFIQCFVENLDIQTYKEIVAFTEGKSLDEIEKAREAGKRPYQKILLAIGAALVTACVAGIMVWVFK